MLDVKVHWTKTATVDIKRDLAVSMAMARATAGHIRRRVLGGDNATPPRPYHGPRAPIIDKRSGRPRKRFYFISPAYAAELGMPGQTRWASSAELHKHAGVKSGTAHTTGGMWRGLRVRNYGKEAALIEFAGSSLGASSVRTAIKRGVKGSYVLSRTKRGKLKATKLKEFSRDEGGNVKYRRKPKRVRNSAKAGRVFKTTKVGLLQPTAAESQAQLAAVSQQAMGVVLVTFGSDQIDGPTAKGDRRLFAAIQREIGRQ